MQSRASLLPALFVVAFCRQALAEEAPQAAGSITTGETTAAAASDAAATHSVVNLPQAPAAERPMATSWYGWQTMIADGTAALLGLVAVPFADDYGQATMAIGITAVGTYALAAPVVHFVHGNVGRGLGSLALRTVLPVASAVIGAKLESCGEDQWFCGLGGAIIGGVAGVFVAGAIDASVLAYETVPARRPSAVPNVGFTFDGKRAALLVRGAF